jgi:SWI/SNF chromatin-remodeling complex subunit SWI1
MVEPLKFNNNNNRSLLDNSNNNNNTLSSSSSTLNSNINSLMTPIVTINGAKELSNNNNRSLLDNSNNNNNTLSSSSSTLNSNINSLMTPIVTINGAKELSNNNINQINSVTTYSLMDNTISISSSSITMILIKCICSSRTTGNSNNWVDIKLKLFNRFNQ